MLALYLLHFPSFTAYEDIRALVYMINMCEKRYIRWLIFLFISNIQAKSRKFQLFLLNISKLRKTDLDKDFFTDCFETNVKNNIYQFSSYNIEDDAKENPISLSKYRSKTLLIIITATFCQYTSQYPHLNKLKNLYRSNQFEILAFPCNQFGLVRL